jgi:cell division protein FtsI/penicillin-binding protein 2
VTSQTSSSRLRILAVALALLLGLTLLAMQLLRWQVVQRGEFQPATGLFGQPSGRAAAAAPASDQTKSQDRGAIVDINGVPLAFDTHQWEIWIEPRLVPKGSEAELTAQLVELLGPALRLTPDELLAALQARETGVVTLTRQGPQAAGETIAGWQRLDIGAKALPVRSYPQGTLAAHLLGFVNGEPRAYYGVEERYDTYLRSMPASFFQTYPENQAFYQQLPAGWREMLPSAVGQDLVLTIDRRLQYITERVLSQAIGQYRAQSGTIIVMNPRDGAILAMASLPAYDPNQYGATNALVLADPAISKQYEPGSVFKIVTMAAGIDAGVVTPDTVLTDTLSIEVGDRMIYNSNMRTFGPVTIRDALVLSLNIPTAQVALKLEEARFYQYIQRFGFGQLTEIDLANEGPGSVKIPGDSLWSRSDLATNAFGQGLAVTPLQMATATAVIANGGLLVRPHVVDSMVFRGRLAHPDTAPVRRVIQPAAAAAVADMMVSVVEDGSPNAKVPGYRVAGKTGTAQVAIQGGYHPTETIHSFVGFVPADDPAFVALVKLDAPKAYAWADGTAAPTFAKLASELLPVLRVPPERVANRP